MATGLSDVRYSQIYRICALAGLGASLLGCGLLTGASYSITPGAPPITLRGDTSLAWGAAEGNRCVDDVPRALSALQRHGVAQGFHLAGAEGVGGYRRHWQGVQRTSSGGATYFFVSRSGSATAVLIVRLDRGPERHEHESPPPANRVVGEIPFDAGYTHAGGLAVIGSVLAVPMDGAERSQVVLYDVTEPERPLRLGALDRTSLMEPATPTDASAVGIVRIADGRYLLVLGVQSSKRLEFYVSTGRSLREPSLAFRQLGTRRGLGVGGFQNLALVSQCDGVLYLVGTHNTAIPPPSRGRDHLHWYVLRLDQAGAIVVENAGERWMHCRYCNFAAAAGLFTTPTGSVRLYATEFWSRGPGRWVALEAFDPSDEGK